MSATLREGETVTPLELFFDLVFVLAHHAVHAAHGRRAHLGGHREGPARARGPVVVVDRLRVAHERGEPGGGRGAARHLRRDGRAPGRLDLRPWRLRRLGADLRGRLRAWCGPCTSRCSGSRARTTRTCASRRAASGSRPRSRAASWSAPRSLDGSASRARLWVLAIAIDFGGPYFFGAAGWKLMPEHFAERHGLIIIIALGESIVAIGAGVTGEITAGVDRSRRRSASLSPRRCGGRTSTSSRWSRRAAWRASPTARSKTRRRATRYSYLHLPMVAGHRPGRARDEEDDRRLR